MIKIAILASGSGTTAEAVVQGSEDGRLNAEVAVIIHNNPGAGVVNQPSIKRHGIATQCINGRTHPGSAPRGAMTDAESAAILQKIQEAGCDLVILLGYMKRIRGALLDAFGYTTDASARMLNTHAGPLPQTIGCYGSGIHQKVYELYKAGELTRTGPTLHQVSAGYDEGPIVQYADEVILQANDTPQTIEERVKKVERYVTPIGINTYIKKLKKET